MTMQIDRRQFVQLLGAMSASMSLAAGAQTPADEAAVLLGLPRTAGATLNRKNVVATQVKAYAWQDEGIETLLDNLQQKGNINTVFAFTFLTPSGRIEAGGPIKLPDHGKYGPADVGGAFFDADPKYFANTSLKLGHSPDPFNVIAEVGPKMKARGMDFFVWDYNNTSPTMTALFPGFQDVCEIDIYGRRTDSACWNHPNYRAQLNSRISAYLLQYPNEVAGIIWGCERMGPLDNLIGGGWTTSGISCFCHFCQTKARERGIAVERAREGLIALDKLFAAAKKQQRPTDGYFVSFWRILLQYPEALAWQTLWNDSYHEVRGELYGTAKNLAPKKPFGFHLVQNVTFSPFYSAADDYARIKHYTDFVKIATYSNSGGERMAGFISHLASTIFADSTPEVLTPVYYDMMGYKEKPYKEISREGLDASDYIGRETSRAIADTNHEIEIYTCVDINVPMPPGSIESTPDRVKAEVIAALSAGPDGIVLCREYTEMTLANLTAAGDASRLFFANHA